METKVPTIDEIKEYLGSYGWKYRQTTAKGKDVILTPYALHDQDKGILIGLRVEGEYIMVNTIGLLKDVDPIHCRKLLVINDKIKLVKLFSVNEDSQEKLDIELGFELWNESCNKDTFFSFMDMLVLGIETVLEKTAKENIEYKTDYIFFNQN